MHYSKIFLTCLLGLFFTVETMAETSIKGDANSDGAVDVVDVMLIVNYILNKNDDMAFSFNNADINGDNAVDVTDVMLCVNIILHKAKDEDNTPPTNGDDAIPGYPVLAPKPVK